MKELLNRRVFAVVAVFLMLGVLIGMGVKTDRTTAHTIGQLRADVAAFKYVNPLLLSSGDGVRSVVFDPLTQEIKKHIDGAIEQKRADSISVYLRELKTGRWSGVNEDDTYVPSSMLKVVTMMAVLKLAEKDPGILNKKIYYTPDESTERYRPNTAITKDYYSVRDLMYNMIVYSDNASNEALLSDMGIDDSFDFVYKLFRLPRNSATQTGSPDFMSAKSFSSIFRVLYNSTLFQWQLSEQVLELLSKTTFSKGIVAGVPEGIAVSHKFGEAAFESLNKDVVRELHDCGIIYLPEDPYFLCVMTKGENSSELQSIIKEISELAWGFMVRWIGKSHV